MATLVEPTVEGFVVHCLYQQCENYGIFTETDDEESAYVESAAHDMVHFEMTGHVYGSPAPDFEGDDGW